MNFFEAFFLLIQAEIEQAFNILFFNKQHQAGKAEDVEGCFHE